MTREAAIQATQQAHRNYAKRQVTWFRREADVFWLDGFGDDNAVEFRAVALVDRALSAQADKQPL